MRGCGRYHHTCSRSSHEMLISSPYKQACSHSLPPACPHARPLVTEQQCNRPSRSAPKPVAPAAPCLLIDLDLVDNPYHTGGTSCILLACHVTPLYKDRLLAFAFTWSAQLSSAPASGTSLLRPTLLPTTNHILYTALASLQQRCLRHINTVTGLCTMRRVAYGRRIIIILPQHHERFSSIVALSALPN